MAGTGSWPEGNVVPAQEVELAKILPPARLRLLKVPSLQVAAAAVDKCSHTWAWAGFSQSNTTTATIKNRTQSREHPDNNQNPC